MEKTFVGMMTLNVLIKVVYNEPDISTYKGFEIHFPNSDSIMGVSSDFPVYDYRAAIEIAFANGYYPLFDSSIDRFVNDGGIINMDE